MAAACGQITKRRKKTEAGAGSNQGLSSSPPTPFSEAPSPKFSLPQKEPPAGNQGFAGEPVSPSYSEATVEGDSCLDRHLVTMVQIRPVKCGGRTSPDCLKSEFQGEEMTSLSIVPAAETPRSSASLTEDCGGGETGS